MSAAARMLEGSDSEQPPNSAGSEWDESTIEDDVIGWLEMETNVYSAAIATLVKDVSALTDNKDPKKLAQLGVSCFAIFITVFLQVFLVFKVKLLVCAHYVVRIRDLYSRYEEHMYEDTEINVNGRHRGVGQFFPERFDDLNEDDKVSICQFPLSQPDFAMVILFIWTMTCLAEVRRCFLWGMRFVYYTPTVTSVKDMLLEDGGEASHPQDQQFSIVGLSLPLKALVAAIFAVQAAVGLFLLWVGCRWLLATPSFTDLILNGMALAFILDLKDMMYINILPKLYQLHTENVRVRCEPVEMDWCNLIIPVAVTLVCAGWVCLYFYFVQQVLPGYKWDVRGVCYGYLNAILVD